MFTLDLICMCYLCFRNPLNYDTTTESLTSLYDLLMHAYTLVFAFIYSVRLNGVLFGGGAFFIGEGLWAPFHEILEATLHLSIQFSQIFSIVFKLAVYKHNSL